MPMRLKVQYSTRVEKQYIGYLENGMKASIVVAPLHLLVSGEPVSISPGQRVGGGAWPEGLQVAGISTCCL